MLASILITLGGRFLSGGGVLGGAPGIIGGLGSVNIYFPYFVVIFPFSFAHFNKHIPFIS
jgi:hypothetical protein